MLRGGRLTRKLRPLIAAVALLVLFSAQPAQANQSITITPTSLDKTILPGQSTSGVIQVLNQADSPFDFKVYASPYSVTGEEYDPSFTPIAGATNVTDWIKLKAAKSSLAPYSASDLNYTIAVPANAKPGGYYAVFFAETESKVAGSGVTTQKRVGTVVYIKVAGDVVEQGQVASWQVPWLQEPNLTQVVRIENSGSVHFAATIKTTIKDLLGNTKLSYTQKRTILPEKTRKVVIAWEKTPAIGIFKVEGSVQFLGKTTPLPAKYVIVLSNPIKRAMVFVVILAVGIQLVKIVIAKRKAKKQP